jgi:hypothetical protein
MSLKKATGSRSMTNYIQVHTSSFIKFLGTLRSLRILVTTIYMLKIIRCSWSCDLLVYILREVHIGAEETLTLVSTAN